MKAGSTRVCSLQIVAATSPVEEKSDTVYVDEFNNGEADITDGDREGREKMGDMI